MRASNKRNYSKLGKQIKKKLIDNDMTACHLYTSDAADD